jgi:uncharacterized protein
MRAAFPQFKLPMDVHPRTFTNIEDRTDMKPVINTKKIIVMFLSLLCLSSCSSSVFEKRPMNKMASFQDLRFKNMVKQGYDWSCGVACLATILREGFDETISEIDLVERVNKSVGEIESEKGLSMYHLLKTAEDLGYVAYSKYLTAEELSAINVPVIIKIDHFNMAHFVIFKGVFARIDSLICASIIDPDEGNRVMPFYQVKKEWLSKENRAHVLVILRKDNLWLENSSLFSLNQ